MTDFRRARLSIAAAGVVILSAGPVSAYCGLAAAVDRTERAVAALGSGGEGALPAANAALARAIRAEGAAVDPATLAAVRDYASLRAGAAGVGGSAAAGLARVVLAAAAEAGCE
ncbi:MAG: hypothetical protein AAF322_09390, partial [Pseudomonadota bacterium]